MTIATSTKARDITSKTYSSTEYKNGFYNRIKGDIDDILSFEKGVSGKTTITKDMIDKKVLQKFRIKYMEKFWENQLLKFN